MRASLDIYQIQCESGPSLYKLKNIKKSHDVKEMLSDAVETERERKRVSMREFVGYGEMHDTDDIDFDNFDDR